MYATVGLFTDYRVRYLVDSPKDAPGSIGHINPSRIKCAGARSAGRSSSTLRAMWSAAGSETDLRDRG